MVTLSENYIKEELEHIVYYQRSGFDGNVTKARLICELLENRYSMDLCFLLSHKFEYIIDAVEYIKFLENEQ